MKKIHSTAIVSEKSIICPEVEIGPYSIIHDNVHIGPGTTIGSYCEVGLINSNCDENPLIIGENSTIRSHSVLYSSSVFGANLVTGHNVSIREKTLLGKNVQVGSLSDIQGSCQIGDYTKLHSNVHVGAHSKIGNFVWLFPYVILTNDPHPPSDLIMGVNVSDFAVIATGSIVLPGIQIAKDSFVGAGSLVTTNTESGYIYSGNPARKRIRMDKIKRKDNSGQNVYPWRKYFSRGYPPEIVQQWKD